MTGFDQKKEEARVKHGVLELVLPKSEEHQPRRVPLAAECQHHKPRNVS